MKKRQHLNQRIFLPVFLASILLIVICVVLVALYLPHWGKQVSDVQATRTAVIAGEKTQFVEAANTAIVIAEQQTLSVAETLTAVPTPTLTPTLIPSPTLPASPTSAPLAKICSAKVAGADRAFYLFPGIGYKGYENIGVGSPVSVLGRYPDRGWYKVSINGKEGWIRSNFVRLDDANCAPTVYSVSFLLGLDQSGMAPLLNDTFASNDNVWTDSTGAIIKSTPDTQTGEQQLVLNAQTQMVVGSDNRFVQDISGFYLVTSVTFSSSVEDNGFLGIRFRDNGTNYYEIRIFPGVSCHVNVFTTGQDITTFLMDPKACISNSYFIEMSFSSKNSLNLNVNGYGVVSSFNFKDTDGLFTNGAIKLVANKGKAFFDFITITSSQ